MELRVQQSSPSDYTPFVEEPDTRVQHGATLETQGVARLGAEPRRPPKMTILCPWFLDLEHAAFTSSPNFLSTEFKLIPFYVGTERRLCLHRSFSSAIASL